MFRIPTIPSERTERRRAGRLKCNHAVCQFGEIRDFSRTGMRVISRTGVKVPKSATTNVRIRACGAQLTVPARVIDNHRRPDGMIETRMAFVAGEAWDEALIAMGRIAAQNNTGEGL